MLRFLRVEHLAVIDALQIEFEPGLNVLTGETGAGKSMLVGAIGLLIGGRASADLIRTGESQATVEAIFEADLKVATTNEGSPLRSADLQVGRNPAELIVRREITAQGRSRAFANDALVTATALKEQTAPLVELHGQHEHQTLLDPQSHLLILDGSAELLADRERVAAAFREWRRVQDELEALQLDEREKAARVDLLKFQVGELENANVREGEDEELTTSRRVLANAEKLQRLCSEAYSALYDSDEAVLARLGTVWKRVGELADLDPVFQPHVAARQEIKSQLEELAQTLRAYGEQIDASPGRLQVVEDRLALLDRLKRKYGATIPEILAKKESLARQLDSLRHADERRAGLDTHTRVAREEFLKLARVLSRKRRDAAKIFSRQLEDLLGELAMPRTQFEIRFESNPSEATWSEAGIDVAECYLSANVGEDLRPLARIASGGELSRVMLAIRTLAAADAAGKTLVFDEVDAGIGGRVAGVVGQKLRRIGESSQVLCITHLPQIAAAGHAHFQISKRVVDGRTHTRVSRLTEPERIEELARMIGGGGPTAAARSTAREMLGAHPRVTKTRGESEAISKGESEGRQKRAK